MKIRFTENQFSKLVNNILLEQGWLGNMKKSFGLIDDFKPIVKSIDNYKMSLKQSPEFFSQLNNFYKKAIQNKDINQIDEMVATIFHIFNPKGKKELEKSAIDETRKLLDAFSQLNGKQDFKDLKNSILLKNNNIYYKSFDQRTIPSRFGEEYADGLSEYNALVNMYNANPKNVVKPIGVVKDAKGNIVGFNLEKIQGKTLSEYSQKSKITSEKLNEIETIIKNLHQKGFAHGDINSNNIMILNDGTIKLIDPVGYPPKQNFPNFDKAVADDLKKLEAMKKQLGY